jgi:hypothetical protein
VVLARALNAAIPLSPDISVDEDDLSFPVISHPWLPLTSWPLPAGLRSGWATQEGGIQAPPLRTAGGRQTLVRCTDHAGRSRPGHAQWLGRWGRSATPGPDQAEGRGREGSGRGPRALWPQSQAAAGRWAGRSPRGPGGDEQWHPSRWP